MLPFKKDKEESREAYEYGVEETCKPAEQAADAEPEGATNRRTELLEALKEANAEAGDALQKDCEGIARKLSLNREKMREKFEDLLGCIEGDLHSRADDNGSYGVELYVCDAEEVSGLDGSHITYTYDSERNCLLISEQSAKYLIYKLFGFAPKAIEINAINFGISESKEELPFFSAFFAETLSVEFTVRGVQYFTDFFKLFRVIGIVPVIEEEQVEE